MVSAERLLDVASGRYVQHPQLVITDGRITAVGKQGDALPPGARRVELPGLTLLPGLIDMHGHLTGDPRYSGYRGLEFTDNFWTVVGVANAKKTLEAGFTTVRNVGSSHYDDVALKQAIEQGHVPGPRIVPATMRSVRPAAIATTPSSHPPSNRTSPPSPMDRKPSGPLYASCASTAPK